MFNLKQRPPMTLLTLDRQLWLDEYLDVNPGEHFVEIEPTGGGKTHMAYQMLGEIMRRYTGQSYVSLMPKPTDPSTAAWATALNLRETPVWPPQRKLFAGKPAGHVLWPQHRMDLPPAERRRLVGDQLRAGLNAQYVRGNSLSLIDDAHSAATYMDLNDHIEEILVNGRAGGAAAFLALQAVRHRQRGRYHHLRLQLADSLPVRQGHRGPQPQAAGRDRRRHRPGQGGGDRAEPEALPHRAEHDQRKAVYRYARPVHGADRPVAR